MFLRSIQRTALRAATNKAFMVISCCRQRELSSVLFLQSAEQILCFSGALNLVVIMMTGGKPEDYGLQIGFVL